jgi:methyl-accepting chemotaxis protein
MTWLANIPIRGKLMLITVLVSALALALAGAILMVYDTKVYNDRITHTTTVQTEMLAASVAAPLSFNDAKAAEEYLKAFEVNPEISVAAIYDANGKIFVSYRHPGSAATVPVSVEPPGQGFINNELAVMRPVREGASVVGSVYLRVNTEPLVDRIIRFTAIFLGVMLGSLLITLPISNGLQRVISRPIREISQTAALIAAGDLTVRPPVEPRTDEIGVLLETFSRMVVNLREMTRQLGAGAHLLSVSASGILATTSETAAASTQIAAAVSQTSVTMEEVKQTVQVSNSKANSVSESATRTAQIGEDGRMAVEEMVHGMGRIREQMDSVAASIQRLSEQSQAIGRIIAAVSDLADQSNLLAVNAAIEAARAGEEGRGFAVVAQEMKSLADQSKHATDQVREMLGEIQKATSASVLATEQGTKTVEDGVRQSARARESIGVLAQSISVAAQAAQQIASSSQEQLAGVNQVATAIENIKQASAQNADGIRQVESATHKLNEFGLQLQQLVAQYKVEDKKPV